MEAYGYTNENKKVLVRGKDRLIANRTAKFGNDVKMVAVDNGKTISLHLKYADGEKLVELPKTKGSLEEFEFELKKNTILPMVGGKLQIQNESLDEAKMSKKKAEDAAEALYRKHGTGVQINIMNLSKVSEPVEKELTTTGDMEKAEEIMKEMIKKYRVN